MSLMCHISLALSINTWITFKIEAVSVIHVWLHIDKVMQLCIGVLCTRTYAHAQVLLRQCDHDER